MLSKKQTVSGTPVRNLRRPEVCNCSLSSYNISGEVFLNGDWIKTKWTDNGDNISGIKDWKLINVSED